LDISVSAFAVPASSYNCVEAISFTALTAFCQRIMLYHAETELRTILDIYIQRSVFQILHDKRLTSCT